MPEKKQLHRFVNDWFHNGQVKYRKGSAYEPNEETTLALNGGHAEAIDHDPKLVTRPFVDPVREVSRIEQLRAQIRRDQEELEALMKLQPEAEPEKKAEKK